MPKDKGSKKGKKKALRQGPLHEDIKASEETGKLRTQPRRSKKGRKRDTEGKEEEFVDAELSRKILQQLHEQQKEEAAAAAGESKAAQPQSSAVARVVGRLRAAEDSDEDEDGLGLDDGDVEEEDFEVDEEDEKALAMFLPTEAPASGRRLLSDVIMDAIRAKEAESKSLRASAMDSGDDTGSVSGGRALPSAEDVRRRMEPQVIEAYSKVATYLRRYTSGPIPKPFRFIPHMRNWEEIILLTDPDNWSPHAMYAATRIFASSFNELMAQRFFNLLLLPRLRNDISQHKRLNHHLYQAVVKAIFKPHAFFRGIVLPLVEDGCTAREAIILCSILAKLAIPLMPAAAALLKLTELPYSGSTTFFMRTLLFKKYNLPYRVIDALVMYFCNFAKSDMELPVVWHQTLLVFVQRYKYDLEPTQKEALLALLKAKPHKGITEEIRRELLAPVPINAPAGTGSRRGSLALPSTPSLLPAAPALPQAIDSSATGGFRFNLSFGLTPATAAAPAPASASALPPTPDRKSVV